MKTPLSSDRIKLYQLEAQLRRAKAGFPSTEILEGGDVVGWVQARVADLIAKSGENKIHTGFGQLLGLSAGVFAFLSTGTAIAPLAPFAITLGLLGYGASVADSALRYGRILPIPFFAFTLQNIATSTSADGREALHGAEDKARHNAISFLPLQERSELEMLVDYQGLILELLSNVPEGKRFAIYFVLRQAYLEQGFENKDLAGQINRLVENVAVDTTLNPKLLARVKGSLELPGQEEPLTQDLFGFGQQILSTGLPQLKQEPPVIESSIAVPESNAPELSEQPTIIQEPEKPKATRLADLPLPQRAEAVVKLLVQNGFLIDRILSSQITAIAGSQRGGKGTLAGLLTILSKAHNPGLTVEYVTAGIDVYPFKCQLLSGLDYPDKPAEEYDKAIATKLLKRLKEFEGAKPYSLQNTLLVIDEAMRLFSLLEDEDRIWAITFLLTRFAKSGAGLILVLHSNNLGAVVGSKNTNGMAATFKDGVNFIGCEAKEIKTGLLTSIKVASGIYFLADPNNFGKPVRGGELGAVPDWLLEEKNPGNNQPDPVRTLLKLFPELEENHEANAIAKASSTDNLDSVAQLEYAFNLDSPQIRESVIQDKLTDIIYYKLAEYSQPYHFEALRSYLKRNYPQFAKSELISETLVQLARDGLVKGNRVSGYYVI